MVRDFASDLSALALNTATLGHMFDGMGAGWSPERVIDACAERGFGGVVFWRREIKEGRAREVGERCRAAGMRVGGLCRTPFLTGPGAAENHLDESKAAIDMAAELGAEALTIVSGGVEPGSKGVLESQKILAERLARLAGYAEESGVLLALEPLNPMFGGNRTCVMTVPDALRVCDAVGAASLGIAVDVYHVWWDGELAARLEAARGRIFGLHLCDWLAETRDMLLDRGMMGDGVADVRGIRRAVEAAGYDGLCEVEVFSERDWWRRPPGEVLDVIVERFRSVC